MSDNQHEIILEQLRYISGRLDAIENIMQSHDNRLSSIENQVRSLTEHADRIERRIL